MTALMARRLLPNIAPIEPIELIWLAFTLSVTASILPGLIGGVPISLSYIVAFVGSAGCGWLWLLSRCLFRGEKSLERWNIYAMIAIIVIEGSSNLIWAHLPNGQVPELYRILWNAEEFVCISAFVLVFSEVFSGYNSGLIKQERRFRQIFGLTFGSMIALTLLWVLNAAEDSLGGQWQEYVLISCALVGVMGTKLCISFRKLHPLSASMKPKLATKFVDDSILANRIIQTLQQDKKFVTPELKVADLAKFLGEHEYKVTQCITGSLGYRNFNHMINSHRIDSAKKVFDNPENKGRSILSVAFDCGFNSIGPFNRAFKQQVGMTPREYRAAIE